MSIFSAIGSFISGIFEPATKLIDEVSTTDEERLTLQNELERIRAATEQELIKYQTKVVELQAKLMEESAKVAVAESQSDSWFTRTYRPAIVTGMFILICLHSFGLLKHDLPEVFNQVFGAVFGVLSVSRSVEKIKKITKD